MWRSMKKPLALAGLVTTLAAEGVGPVMTLSSPAFSGGQGIPRRSTCQGENLSPALEWSSIPKGTKSLAILCEDPDAPGGTWVHWIVTNIPPDAKGIPEGALPKGASVGQNSWWKLGYGGPCPPPGKLHHYSFHLYALDAALSLTPGAMRAAFEEAIRGHILGQAELLGTYERSGPRG